MLRLRLDVRDEIFGRNVRERFLALSGNGCHGNISSSEAVSATERKISFYFLSV